MVNYRAIHLLTFFRDAYGFRAGEFPVAERLGDQNLSLPFYPGMLPEHVDRVVDELAAILNNSA
jgi:dTDP-4-amino-4,6-dideoxygalactose transaminase